MAIRKPKRKEVPRKPKPLSKVKVANQLIAQRFGNPYIALSRRMFPTPEVYTERALACLSEIKDEGRPLTIPGLAVRLGVSASCYAKYESGEMGEEYVEPMEYIRTIVEAEKNEGMLSGLLQTSGAIFDLKNSHGWKDDKSININGRMRISAEPMTSDEWEDTYGGDTLDTEAS